ncbi:hypothetical protein [Bacillus sp. OV166]|uniref:hypothetical protein n=1 Tax=Bacillus sp. OV166 TaxID=1882763 RepID=UPI00211B3100|nr:hypothetical protein [Bacillus sp. OV166]
MRRIVRRRRDNGWTVYTSLAEIGGKAKTYPFNWIKEIDEHHFDSLFKEDNETEFGIGNFTFRTVKSENKLNQMSEACFFFAAPSVILHENYSLSFRDVQPLLLEILIKDFVPHYKNVKQLFILGEFKEIRFEDLKEESKKIVENLIAANFYPVISDLYRGKYAEKSGMRKLQYFLINKEDITPLYSKETEKIQQFIQSAFFDQNEPFCRQPVGWKLEQNLKESITIRSFCTFAKEIVLLVNAVDDSVEAMYIFG